MSERIPAFREKLQKREESRANKTEGPLQSLEKDQAQITGFKFALTEVLNGQFTTNSQLQALVDPKFRVSGGNPYLLGGDNDFLRINGSVISQKSLGGGMLAAEQIPILMGLSRERSSAQEGEKSAEAQITGFKFALTEVLNGQFTTNSQLQALVDPKFRVSGGNPYLLGGDNDFLRINGSVISQKSLGGGRLAAERIPIRMVLSRERSSAQEGEKSAEAQITGFKFALTEVLNGQFTTNSQLQALVDPKFRVSGGNPYLLGGDNDFLRINGSVISQKSLGGGRLAAERIPIRMVLSRERSSAQEGEKSAEAQITGFKFALTEVLNGQFTTNSQLQALVDPKFRVSGGNPYLLGGDNDFLRINGSVISQKSLGGGRLAAEQIPILMGLSRERSSAQEGEKSAEAQITGFKFALTEVLNGQFTTNSQLQALVDPKFRVSGGNPYLVGDDNDFLRINGSVISQKSLGGGRLAAEDFVLLGRFLNIADNPSFPNEVKENLKQYLKTNNLSGLERLNTIMAAAKDDTMSSEVNSLVADLIKTRRVVELKKDVYGGIVANKPNGELSKKISEFEGKETSD